MNSDISRMWNEVVLGAPAQEPQEPLVDWMWQTLSHATDSLIDLWGLSFSRDLSLRENFLEVYSSLAQREAALSNDGRRVFSCWPTLMKESGYANCVGRTLIGVRLLDRLSIPHAVALMPFHVVNLISLGDGRWMYADLANAVFKETTPTPTAADSFFTFDRAIDLFQVAAPLAPKSLVYLILCNLLGIKLVGENEESRAQCPDSLEREARIALYERHRPYLRIDLAGIIENLFPEEERAMGAPIMEEETARVRALLQQKFLGRDAPFAT